jgi:ribosome-associated translation inhibitor RaiA
MKNSLPEKSSAQGQPINIEAEPEFKAHVYQQLLELQPLLAGNAHVAVCVRRGPNEYRAALKIAIEGSVIEALGQDANLYIALSKSREALAARLLACRDLAQDSRERDLLISAYTSLIGPGSRLIH